MVGGKAIGSGKFHLILSLFDHGPGKEMCKGVIGYAEFLLHKCYDGGCCVLCGTFMRISGVSLVFTFDETDVACGQVFDTNIGDTASASNYGDDFPCLGHGSELATFKPDVFCSGCSRLGIHGGVQFIGVFVVNVLEILRMGDNLIDARICLIEVSTNHINGLCFCPSPALIRNELPVTTTSKIVFCGHEIHLCSAGAPSIFIATK